MSNKIKGIFCYILCCLCFVLYSILTRYIPHSNPFMIIFFRDIICLIYSGLWIAKTDVKLFQTQQIGFQLVRSIVAFLGISCWLFSVSNLPLPEATALNLTVPIFSSIIAILVLKEKMQITRIIGIMVGMLGAYIVVLPDLNNFNLYYILPLLSAIMFSIYNNIVRFLTFKNDPKTVMFYFFLFQIIICIPFIINDFTWLSLYDLAILALISITALLNVYFHAKSLQLAEITQVETFDFSRLVFACILGFILFDEIIQINTIIGAGIIILTSIAILKYEKFSLQKSWYNNIFSYIFSIFKLKKDVAT